MKNVTYFVSATDAEILSEIDNVRHNNIYGTIRGSYWPVRSTDTPVVTGFATTNVSLTNSLGQVWRVNTNSNGYYQFSGLSYAYYRVGIPLEHEWIQVRDNAGSYGTHGALVEASYTMLPGQRDHDWGSWDGTNVFWHGRIVHDFFRGSPFNYTGIDRRMNAYVNSGSAVNGRADGTHIYFGSEDGRPWARSSDVVYHEYTHNTIHSVYSGWIGTDGQGAAMDEGLSDYFACTANNDPIMGEDVGISRNLDNNTFTWTDWRGPHWNGQVVGGAVWDFRETAGPTVANNLAFKALQVVPRARNFSDYLYNMMVVDNGTYNATYRIRLRNAFSAHAISTTEPLWPGPTNLTYTGQQGQSPTLQWQYYAPTDFGFSHFRVYRRADGGPYEVIATPTTTSYTDYQVVIGGTGIENVFEYYVTAFSQSNGESGVSNTMTVNGQSYLKRTPDIAGNIFLLSETFALWQNYPNPFNPETQIRFGIPEPSAVKITILDVLGREVQILKDEWLPAGYHSVVWRGRNSRGEQMPSGVYFYRISAVAESGYTFSKTARMMLIR